MIVDCHTHVWESPGQWGLAGREQRAGRSAAAGGASLQQHQEASRPVDVSFVLGFRSLRLGAEIPNRFVAGYVRQHPDRLVGFAGVDPSDLPRAMEEMEEACTELGLKGLTVSPTAQEIHPAATQAMRLYAEASRLGVPIIFDNALVGMGGGRMDFGRPALLDEVAGELPELRMVVSHMGWPWVDEAVVLLGRHPNVFADVSGLLQQPWQAYQGLLSAYHGGVMEKLLFGSDFPYGSATSAIEALYSLNRIGNGTNLPTIPRQQLRGIVERDVLALLSIRGMAAAGRAGGSERTGDDERV
jgi:predicted TIM-barrel fold metal-dependent hydrolase